MSRKDKGLTGLVVTEIVPDGDLTKYLRKCHAAGGRLAMSSPCCLGGEPAYAVTFKYGARR